MNENVTREWSDRLRDLIRNYVSYGAVALVCLAYVAASFLTVEATGKSVQEIVSDGAMAFLLGISVNRMMELQGMRNGDRDVRVKAAEERHAALVEEVAPTLDALDLFCEEKNKETLARARRTYLSRLGLRYNDYFDGEGICVCTSVTAGTGLRARLRRREEKKHVRRAARLHLTRLSAGLLISDAGNTCDPYFLGRSKREYERESGRGELVSKLATAAVFGYYGVSLLQGFSVADLIWTVLQVGLFLLMGGVRMERTYLYVVDEYRARIQKKSDVMRMFLASKQRKEEEYAENE